MLSRWKPPALPRPIRETLSSRMAQDSSTKRLVGGPGTRLRELPGLAVSCSRSAPGVACASSRGFAGCVSTPREVDCKPGPVPASGCPLAGEDHSSRRRVAAPLEHSHPDTGDTRMLADASGGSPWFSAPIRACSGKGLPRRRSPGCRAWALTPRFHPYLCELDEPASHRRYYFCCAFPRVAPGRRYRLPHPVEPGLSSHGRFMSAGDPLSTSGGAERRRRVAARQF